MKHYIMLFLAMFLTTNIALAQAATDYYIDKDGNRIEGSIRLKVVEAIPQFLFTNPSNGQEIELFPENVQEIRDGKKIYISRRVQYAQSSTAVDDIFLERIIQGPVSYYHNKYTEIKYFFEKDGVTKSLYREKVENNLSTGIDSFYINKFLDVFYEFFGDCSRFEYTKRYKLSKNSLIEYVDDYNECVDPSYVRLKDNDTEFFVELGLGVGNLASTFNATAIALQSPITFDFEEPQDVVLDVSISTNIYKERLLVGLRFTSVSSSYDLSLSGNDRVDVPFTTKRSFFTLSLAYRIPIVSGLEFRPILGGVIDKLNKATGNATVFIDNGNGLFISRFIKTGENSEVSSVSVLGFIGGSLVYPIGDTFNLSLTGQYMPGKPIPKVLPVGSNTAIDQDFYMVSLGVIYKLKLK